MIFMKWRVSWWLNNLRQVCMKLELEQDICDLSGVRVALYFPKDRDKVKDIIEEKFNLIENPKEFPDKEKQ